MQPTRLQVATEETVQKEVIYGLESWKAGYKTCKKETVEAIVGDLPKDLEGTYFRNGFGKFEAARVPILHPFDADGMIAAVTMKVSKLSKIKEATCNQTCSMIQNEVL